MQSGQFFWNRGNRRLSWHSGYLTGWKAVDRRGTCRLAEISHRGARRGHMVLPHRAMVDGQPPQFYKGSYCTIRQTSTYRYSCGKSIIGINHRWFCFHVYISLPEGTHSVSEKDNEDVKQQKWGCKHPSALADFGGWHVYTDILLYIDDLGICWFLACFSKKFLPVFVAWVFRFVCANPSYDD